MLSENSGKMALQGLWLGMVALLSTTILLDVRYQRTDFSFRNGRMELAMQEAETPGPEEDAQRIVASSYNLQKPGVQYFPVNKENRDFISGIWAITRYIDHLARPSDINKKVRLQLVATSTVEINGNHHERFSISVINANGTMALMRPLLSGYEILELRRISRDVDVKTQMNAAKSVVWVPQKTFHGDDGKTVQQVADIPDDASGGIELELEKGFSSSGDFSQDQVEGTMKKYDNFLDIDVRLKKADGTFIEIRLDGCEVNGTSFIANSNGETFIGLINENGSTTSLTVRFPIGPFQGISLNFASGSEIEQRQANNQEEMQESVVAPVNTGMNKSSIRVLDEREQGAETDDDTDISPPSEEAKAEVLEQEGYQF